MKNPIIFLKNKFKKSKIYWKLRHLHDRNIWLNYFNDASSPKRDFYKIFVEENKVNSVFEFGCASGPNYLKLKHQIDYYFGFDISKSAIATAKNRISTSNKIIFSSDLNENKRYLEQYNLNVFDLAIYDRVLYLLNEKEINTHFKNHSNKFKYIIINDFFNEKKINDNEDYLTTNNFSDILVNFSLIQMIDSKHSAWNNFTEKYAKILFYKNKNIK